MVKYVLCFEGENKRESMKKERESAGVKERKELILAFTPNRLLTFNGHTRYMWSSFREENNRGEYKAKNGHTRYMWASFR